MGNGSGRYEVKRCPRCDSELYADMDVCYGCLYDFSRGAAREVPLPSVMERSLALRHADEVGVVVRGSALEVWTPVGDGGAVVGGRASCDVILRAPPVSDRHLRLVPTSDGMEVSDLGSSVRATYRSRPIDRRVVVPYGDAIDVCGCQLTMTGPRPTSPSGT
ncbi:FHA domain-containing protein [Olsenella sp. An293]|uniref:FHA domain-containing protein n=1 Tax=Olsenella sp. An293 TaxID=1965626 RepID=UPI000B3A16DF|nr:FHA domain-containing protein [Olsenella sp. An293]OUO32811.1 hypothetical protein B5F85_04130 [Olsenella sp. An293]